MAQVSSDVYECGCENALRESSEIKKAGMKIGLCCVAAKKCQYPYGGHRMTTLLALPGGKYAANTFALTLGASFSHTCVQLRFRSLKCNLSQSSVALMTYHFVCTYDEAFLQCLGFRLKP